MTSVIGTARLTSCVLARQQVVKQPQKRGREPLELGMHKNTVSLLFFSRCFVEDLSVN